MAPKFRFIFVFGPHRSAEDSKSLIQAAKRFKPHFFSTESGGLPESERRNFEDALNKGVGLLTAEFDVSVMELVGQHKIPIKQFDYQPDRTAQNTELIKTVMHPDIIKKMNEAILSGDHKAALDAEREFNQSMRQLLKGKHEQIVANARTVTKEILDEHPELRNEPEVRILMPFGTGHHDIVNDFRSAGYGAEAVYTRRPLRVSPTVRLMRESGPITDNAASYSLMSGIIADYCKEIAGDTNKLDAFSDEIAQRVSISDARKIFHEIAGAREKFHKAGIEFTIPDASEVTARWLDKNKGIVLPKTPQEFEAALKKVAPTVEFGLFSEKEMEER